MVPRLHRPTLGFQAPLVQELRLNGQIDDAHSMTTSIVPQIVSRAECVQAEQTRVSRVYGPEQVVENNRPTSPARPHLIRLCGSISARRNAVADLACGWTTANANGQWSLSTRRPLPDGQYRVVVTSFSHDLRTRPGLTIVPTQPLGRLVVTDPTS